MSTLLQDLRYAWRMLRKNPGFTAVAVLTLALGIGANTAIFTVVNAVLLRPLPYPDPGRIVQFMLVSPPWAPGRSSNAAAIPEFMVWRELTETFKDFAAYDSSSKGINLTGGDRPELLKAVRVSVDYFRLFGVPVEVGRTFSPEEDRPGGPRLVVISDRLWRRRFGADRSLVSKAILLAGDPYVVIGVLGPGFASDPPAEIWLPAQVDPYSTNFSHDFRAAARLRPGIRLEMAKIQMKLATEQFRRKFPATRFPAAIDPQETFTVELLRAAVVGDARLALLVLLGAVSFVLLIACANIANLLLARATGRRRELAIRAALGAGRRRIVSQLLTESGLLSLVGGTLGLVLGCVGVRALLAIEPGDIPRIGAHGSAVTLDWHVLVFTLVISALTAILFGLLPALSVSHEEVRGALEGSGARSGGTLGESKARSLLVVTEMALSLVLLAGAALLIRTFMTLRTVDPGFDGRNVLTMEMSLAGRRFAKTAAVGRLVREAKRRVESIPGVEALAVTAISLPLEGYVEGPFEVEGRSKDGQAPYAAYNCLVSPRYFEVFRIPLLRGRLFTEQDETGAPGVVVINEAAARQFWPKGDPVGQRIFVNKGMGPEFEEPPRQIIGVVADVRDTGLIHEPPPILYLPVVQIPDSLIALGNWDIPITWVVRTKVQPYSLRADIQRELRIASGGLPVSHIRSMDQASVGSTARTNFNMTLLSIFAVLAVLLATIGIYGVMSYTVGQRVREIGIRVALGARAGNVLSLVLRQGLSLAVMGIGIGLLGGIWLTEAMKRLLYGVSPNDPLTFAMVSALLLAVAAVATYIPARRATKVDPIVALRYE